MSVDEWLLELGLDQYAAAFRAGGYDDITTLAHLDDFDLDAINLVLAAQQQLAGEGRLPVGWGGCAYRRRPPPRKLGNTA